MDTKKLVEQLRSLVIRDEVGSNNPMAKNAADLIEKLTQPVGVEPACFTLAVELDYAKSESRCGAYWTSNDGNDPDFLPLYSAETVARLQAERDEAKELLHNATKAADDWKRRYEGMAILHANKVRMIENGELIYANKAEAGGRNEFYEGCFDGESMTDAIARRKAAYAKFDERNKEK